jgi:REP element-mobilizing transposase RayT
VQPAFSTFHVTARGVRREPIFLDRLDHRRHVELLGMAVQRFGWDCFAWCHVTNHFHLVVRLREETLSAGMHWLNWMYARRFNERYGLTGHVFERRFHGELVAREEHLLETLRYVALNPVRAGLCADPAEYEWSSFRATARLCRPEAFLARREVHELFGRSPARAAERYAAFVRAGLGDETAVA